jgi:hypothetical protein
MPRQPQRSVRSGTASEMTSKYRHDPSTRSTNVIGLLAGRDQRLHVHPTVGVTKVCPEHPANGLPALNLTRESRSQRPSCPSLDRTFQQ